MLSVRNLSTEFRTQSGIARALDNISVEVREGEVVGLVGESGAGKSLLLASMLNLVNPPGRVVSGEVLFHGRDLRRVPERELNKIRGGDISFIGPNPHTLLNPLLPVGDQVMKFLLAHRRLTKQAAREQVIDMFRAVGIPAPDRRFNSYPHELSGGMAQRVVISVGLICSPQLVLADEPTFGLDVTIQAQVLELIRHLVVESPDHAMLIVTRDLGIVANYCDSLYVLQEGSIVESGSVVDFFRQPSSTYGRELLRSVELSSGSSPAPGTSALA
jgi:ABC-type dipeptide/oligopeptide/nickel transport system ATPase component